MNYYHQQAIIKRMARAGIPFVLAQAGSKKKHIVTERQIIIQLLYHFEGLQQNDIAFLLHLSQASVSRSMKNFRIRHNAALKDDNFEKKYLEYRTKYEAICKRAQQDSNMQI